MGSFVLLNVLNPELTYLKLPGVPSIVLEELPDVNACLTGQVPCEDVEECKEICGGDYWSCEAFPFNKRCIQTKPNTGVGGLCRINEDGSDNCLDPAVCILVNSSIIGVCTERGQGQPCIPDEPCEASDSGLPQSCEPTGEYYTVFWWKEPYYACVPSEDKKFNDNCESDPTSCRPPMVCKNVYKSLSDGYINVCTYQSEEDCYAGQASGDIKTNNELTQCITWLSCPDTSAGGADCVEPYECCTDTTEPWCNDSLENTCVIPQAYCTDASCGTDQYCCEQASLDEGACYPQDEGRCLPKSGLGGQCDNNRTPEWLCAGELLCCDETLDGVGDCNSGTYNTCVQEVIGCSDVDDCIPSIEFCCEGNYLGSGACDPDKENYCLPKVDAGPCYDGSVCTSGICNTDNECAPPSL